MYCYINCYTLGFYNTYINLMYIKSYKIIAQHKMPSQIPQVVYKLTSLTHLFLRFNRIKHVHQSIRNLQVCLEFSL